MLLRSGKCDIYIYIYNLFQKYINQLGDTQHFFLIYSPLRVSAAIASHRQAAKKKMRTDGDVTELVRLVAIC
jgi:hypothetical protein